MVSQSLAQLLLLASVVAAQKPVPVWSQCGGQNYAGPTACASGNYCNYGNPWYSQCLPGSEDEPLDGNVPDSPLETNTVQTIITIGGGQGNGGAPPITVTTSYTYLLPSTTIYGPHHSATQTPAPPAPGGGNNGGGNSPPLLTVIGGTTYTIIQDPPATGRNKRGEILATAVAMAVEARATTLYNDDGRPLVADDSLAEKPVKATPTAQWTTIVTLRKA